MVRFDGSCVETPAMITEHLEVIFGGSREWVLCLEGA